MWTDGQQRVIEELTRQYCEESKVLAKKRAGENERRSRLFLGSLQPLNRFEPEILMLAYWHPLSPEPGRLRETHRTNGIHGPSSGEHQACLFY
jgi:hypothetical protein